MINHVDLHLALRTRLLDVVVCTTGSATIAATPSGFSRTSGSFLTDGFRVGMEIQPFGFTTAEPAVVSAVTATMLTVTGTRVPQGAASGRRVDAVLPSRRAWENMEFRPEPGWPYLEEDFVPGTSELRSASANGGLLEDTGLYVLRCVGLQGTGSLAIRAMVAAMQARYAPGLALLVAAGAAYVRGDVAPTSSAIRRLDGGWAVCTLTVPWRAYARNAIAA
jgi:hypothetical protein